MYLFVEAFILINQIDDENFFMDEIELFFNLYKNGS